MKPGRPVLRYFGESDLKPLTSQSINLHKPLLDKSARSVLTRFSEEFVQTGEVVFDRPTIAESPHLAVFIDLCRAWGAVSVQDAGNTFRVRPSGRLGRHLPEILCMYLESGYTVIDNWNSLHLIPEDRVSALELLHQMELRRIEQDRRSGHTPKALAERPVAFAVFHAKNGKGESCYLFEVNKDWRRLNFIGGKQESVDEGDFTETIVREIDEELGIPRGRLILSRLNQEPIVGYSLSGNAGSLARYPCVLYGVRVEGQLTTRMQDRWLTESVIREAIKADDSPIMVNPQYFSYLLEGSPPRISRLPLSTDRVVHTTNLEELVPPGEPVRRRWMRVTRENKDLAAAVITIVAAVITLVIAF